jgi:ABC-2 type transport system ATP-binding protein
MDAGLFDPVDPGHLVLPALTGTGMPTTILEACDLNKRYGTLAAVKDLWLDVFEGEILGLLGPNGAGKTTSINMLCGLLKPDSGQVRIRGRIITQGDAEIRSRVGVCPQDIILWKNLSCLEQMQFIGEMYGMKGRAARLRGASLLEQLDLSGKKDKLACTLSGGMQRRLNLAMALVHDPEILVLDEPEAGLDPQSRVMLRDYIKSLGRNKTIILTTHNMDEADRMATRVAIIDHGRLLTVDTPEALKSKVGEGDVLEIEMTEDALGRAASAVSRITPDVTSVDHTLVIRARGMVDLLPTILNALSGVDAQPQEVRLRENSLEDVFISLTGRRLRE